jgi:SAM-dependent methyltransferase
MSSKLDRGSAAGHYARLATSYNQNWTYDPSFIEWMIGRIVEHASIQAGDVVADIGCGTGLYSRKLAAVAGQVICVDPSQAMLDQVPHHTSLIRVLASSQAISSGHVALPIAPLDVVVVKQSLHHIPSRERAQTLRGLAGLLRPGGRIIVVMLPARIGYPLFQAALERFERDHPDPEHVTAMLADAELETRTVYEEYEIQIPKERYLPMVRDRYMSLLSTFDDDELELGIAEIDNQYRAELLEFTDRFAFIRGLRQQATCLTREPVSDPG